MPHPRPSSYRWTVVGLLWACGFFNYADRQAVFSVFPLIGAEFGLSGGEKGMIGSAFMIVYAALSPLAGRLVDLATRRRLVALGLAFWSVVCGLTALSRQLWQLLLFRAAEGLGESFYFPASMSLIADFHGPATRSRAMSLHQTSVYAGTAAGGILAGYLGQHYGWRAPFYFLGAIGLGYAILLPRLLVEPGRGASDAKETEQDFAGEMTADTKAPGLWGSLARIVSRPAAVALLATFAGANFVAATMLTWLPEFVKTKFGLDLTGSAVVATLFMPSANLVGAVGGGVLADAASTRVRSGRVLVQASGLLLGAPFIYLVGATNSLPVLVVALIGIGLCKGVYDANIFASLYDVVPVELRGTAAGLMNTVGWTGASFAPVLIGLAGDRVGLSRSIGATAGVYVVAGVLALAAFRLARGAKA